MLYSEQVHMLTLPMRSRDRISLSIRQCQAKPLKPRTPDEIARDAEAEDVKEWMDSHPDTSAFSNIGGAFDGIKL